MNNIESSVEVSEFTFADKVAEQIVMEALFMERFGVPVSYLSSVSKTKRERTLSDSNCILRLATIPALSELLPLDTWKMLANL